MTNPLKGKGDMVKNVIIAVLVTGIVAFVAGMRYNAGQTARTEAKVHAAVQTLQSEASKN